MSALEEYNALEQAREEYERFATNWSMDGNDQEPLIKADALIDQLLAEVERLKAAPENVTDKDALMRESFGTHRVFGFPVTSKQWWAEEFCEGVKAILSRAEEED